MAPLALPDEHATAHHRGLRGAHRVALERERPFQFQVGHVGRVESGLWLIAGIRQIDAPAVPIGVAHGERAGGGGAFSRLASQPPAPNSLPVRSARWRGLRSRTSRWLATSITPPNIAW